MLVCKLLTVAVSCALAAANDNNVEWNGISHVGWQDRRPLCPRNGETFDVFFQAYRFDLTAARVYVNDGISPYWVDAAFDHDRRPYAVWAATIPATASNTLSYYIEVTDGTDTDYLGPNGFGHDGMSDGPPASSWTLNFTTLEHAPFGATLHPSGGVIFKVWAPAPTSAYVRGQFNSWGLTNPMTNVGDYFITYVSNAAYRQMYKLYFEPGATWKPDARAKSLNPGDNYNTHIESQFAYQWEDDSFETPPFEEMVLYELHVGTFSGYNDPVASGSIPGTYLDVAAHVDHLVELGVNVVELMPVTEYSWDFSAGYNPVSAWAPEWKHGTPNQLKEMIDVLHENGIAVILDIVWNHFSNDDNYLWLYTRNGGGAADQIYFDGDGTSGQVETPWGSQADFDEQQVRDYFAESSLYWLEEFRMDGFRMDATEYMNLYQGSGWGLMQRFNNEIDGRWVDKIAIAEQLPNDPWVTRQTSQGGAGFDSQWHDAFTDTLHYQVLQAGWNQSAVDMWALQDVILGSGAYLSNTQVTNYLELHDELWPSSGGQRIVKTIDTAAPHDDIYAKGRTKMAQGIVMFSPGIPIFHQGSEWLESIDFGSGSPSGTDRIDWSKKTTYAGIFQYYCDMVAVRKANCALRSNINADVFHVNNNHPGKVIAWERNNGQGNRLVIVANFSDNNYTNYAITLPAEGTWYEILNSQAAEYEGNGWGNGGSVVAGGGGSALMTIPQMGLLVLRYEDPPGRGSDLEGSDGDTDLADFAVMQREIGSYGCGLPADLNEDGRVLLDDLAELVDNLTGPS